MIRFTFCFLLCTLPAFVGCGGGGSGGSGPQAQVDKVTTNELEGMKELLQQVARSRKPIPNRLSEMQSFEPAFPELIRLLNSGECVYVWGCNIKAGSTAVLAYGKSVPDSGGPVLLQDGTVKTMSAAEFTAAPKAKK